MLTVNRLNLISSSGSSAASTSSSGTSASSSTTHDQFIMIDGGSDSNNPVTAPLGNTSCYNPPYGGCLTVSASAAVGTGGSVIAGINMITQYADNSVTWVASVPNGSSQAAGVTKITPYGVVWTFSNVNDMLQVTVPTGKNLIRISKNY